MMNYVPSAALLKINSNLFRHYYSVKPALAPFTNMLISILFIIINIRNHKLKKRYV